MWIKCLPALRGNRNIRKAWRMLLSRFQGLEIPNINIDIMCSKIYCVKNHWGEQRVTGNLLCQAYEVFQVEVGLSGRIFN